MRKKRFCSVKKCKLKKNHLGLYCHDDATNTLMTLILRWWSIVPNLMFGRSVVSEELKRIYVQTELRFTYYICGLFSQLIFVFFHQIKANFKAMPIQGYQLFVSPFRDTLIPRIPTLMQQKHTKHDRHQQQQRVLRVME